MGTVGGNGGSWPPEGGGPPDDLPELPPEWGVVVIPDDPAELAEEATRVRKELRRTARSRTWRRRLHLPPPRARRRNGDDVPTLGVPLLIVSIAVLATLASLFAVAWPAQPRQTPVPTSAATPAGAAPTAAVTLLPDVTLPLADGAAQLRLRSTVPAVFLLVDGCECADLIAKTIDAATATDPGIGVIAVARAAPAVGPAKPRVWAAADPSGALRSALAGLAPSTGTPVVLIVDGADRVIRVASTPASVDAFRDDLAKLKPR
jgi:hypothetical protein